MNTPNETPKHHQRAAFWLHAIDARKAKLTREYRKSLRDTAREGISDEEYAAMLGTLEKMARNLGWDESQTDERPFGRGHGRGFGRGHRHPAMMRGFGHARGAEDQPEHEHRYPGAKRGFRRMHPADHRDLHTDTPPMNSVATETPQA